MLGSRCSSSPPRATCSRAGPRARAVVEIDEETPILTIDEALAAGSIFEEGPRIYAKGDVDTALTRAPHVIEGRIEIGGQEHFYLEGQSALALPQEGGDMIVHSSSQHPTEIQHKVADAIGRPMHAVRVEVRRMGGGFGGKESQGNHLAIACAVVAARTGRPAKMRYDRDDDFVVTGKRHDARIDYRVGVDGDGRLLAVDFVQMIRCGWSMDLSLPVADRAMLHADNAYLMPNARITSHRLKTNTQSATAFRGFGGPQGMVGIERVMDHVAHALGKDPMEVRRLNYYAEAQGADDAPEGRISGKMKGDRLETADLAGRGSVKVETGSGSARRFGGAHSPVPMEDHGNSTPYGMEVEDFILGAMTARLRTGGCRRAEGAAWPRGMPQRHPQARHRGDAGEVRDFLHADPSQPGGRAGACLPGRLHPHEPWRHRDGPGPVPEGGAGGRRPVRRGDGAGEDHRDGHGKVPNTSATAASSGSDLNGMAVKAACDEIQGADRGGGGAGVAGRPAQGRVRGRHGARGGAAMPFEEAVQKTYMARVSLSATGFYKTPKIEWDRIAGRGRPFFYFAYGVACSEVVIDTLTGENRILGPISSTIAAGR
jgi:xanthine dehydrogenase large subunit